MFDTMTLSAILSAERSDRFAPSAHSPLTVNTDRISGSSFSGEAVDIDIELDELHRNVMGDAELTVDQSGAIRPEDDMTTESNGSYISGDTFAAQYSDMQSEIDEMRRTVVGGGSGMTVDRYGVIHFGSDSTTDSNGAYISGDTFAGEALDMELELDQMRSVVVNNDEVFVDRYGVAHLGSDASTAENATHVAGRTFGGDYTDMQSELDQMRQTVVNNGGVFIDQNGVAHLDDDTSTAENGTHITGDTFAGEAVDMEDELNQMRQTVVNNGGVFIDREGIAHLDDDTSPTGNGTYITGDTFAGDPQFADPIDPLYTGADAPAPVAETSLSSDDGYHADIDPLDTSVFDDGVMPAPLDPDEVIRAVEDTAVTLGADGNLNDTSDPEATRNAVRISGDTFAAGTVPVPPSDPDQWYNKRRSLYIAEVEYMHKKFPGARLGFLKSNHCMYWTITLKISQKGFTKPWTFFLVYQKDHPNNRTYGGSVKVVPVTPSIDDLKRTAMKYRRPGVPHIVNDPGNTGIYLCTRVTSQVADGTRTASTAVQTAAWAADWAMHFELGMRYDDAWNKWVDDKHYYRWRTDYREGMSYEDLRRL